MSTPWTDPATGTVHELYAAIASGYKGGIPSGWHGAVRCVIDGLQHKCPHAHKTRSAAMDCAEKGNRKGWQTVAEPCACVAAGHGIAR